MQSWTNMNQQKNTRLDSRQQATTKIESGELGFLLVLAIVGLFFVYRSILLYRAYPGAESCASVPLFVSVVIAVLSLTEVIAAWKKRRHSSDQSIVVRFKAFVCYLFNANLLVLLLLIALYCVGLFWGVGFLVMTPLFLFASMCFLQKGGYVKNMIWTALIMIFIVLVFQKLFSIVLP